MRIDVESKEEIVAKGTTAKGTRETGRVRMNLLRLGHFVVDRFHVCSHSSHDAIIANIIEYFYRIGHVYGAGRIVAFISEFEEAVW